MPTAKKVQQVADLEDLFKSSAGCWFVDARGLTVKEAQELRVNIRQAGGAMHVFKNTLALIAMKNLELPEMSDILAGPTAFIFCPNDVAAPAKAVKEFMKEHQALEMKGGVVDGAAVNVEDALKIADLPSKEQLVAMLLGTMVAPITSLARVCSAPSESLARAVKAIAEQQEAA